MPSFLLGEAGPDWDLECSMALFALLQPDLFSFFGILSSSSPPFQKHRLWWWRIFQLHITFCLLLLQLLLLLFFPLLSLLLLLQFLPLPTLLWYILHRGINISFYIFIKWPSMDPLLDTMKGSLQFPFKGPRNYIYIKSFQPFLCNYNVCFLTWMLVFDYLIYIASCLWWSLFICYALYLIELWQIKKPSKASFFLAFLFFIFLFTVNINIVFLFCCLILICSFLLQLLKQYAFESHILFYLLKEFYWPPVPTY